MWVILGGYQDPSITVQHFIHLTPAGLAGFVLTTENLIFIRAEAKISSVRGEF